MRRAIVITVAVALALAAFYFIGIRLGTPS